MNLAKRRKISFEGIYTTWNIGTLGAKVCGPSILSVALGSDLAFKELTRHRATVLGFLGLGGLLPRADRGHTMDCR